MLFVRLGVGHGGPARQCEAWEPGAFRLTTAQTHLIVLTDITLVYNDSLPDSLADNADTLQTGCCSLGVVVLGVARLDGGISLYRVTGQQ